MLDTDALLQPIAATNDQIIALMELVKANTAAFKDIRLDLGHCNNQEKTQAILNKVEQAIQDLSIESQKVPPWAKAEPKRAGISAPYGQYPIDQPLNPANPVRWPPGYSPAASHLEDEPNPTVQEEHEPDEPYEPDEPDELDDEPDENEPHARKTTKGKGKGGKK